MVEYHQAPELDQVFAALADPTRRAILQALARRPATINEIAGPFPVSLNAISKHVMVLENAGLVRREIKGREHHCRVDPCPLREANEWLEHYREFWERRLDALELYVTRKFKASKIGMTHGKLRRRQTPRGGTPPNASAARRRI
jgi:DNA-binding transcriptional ArsR family regulator